MLNKKGISEIGINIIILLIMIFSLIVLNYILYNSLKDEEGVVGRSESCRVKIEPVSCLVNTPQNTINVTIRRNNLEANLKEIRLTISDAGGYYDLVIFSNVPGPSETITYSNIEVKGEAKPPIRVGISAWVNSSSYLSTCDIPKEITCV